MKLIIPEFLYPHLAERVARLAPQAEIVVISAEGELAASPEGAEILLLPWRLSEEMRRRLMALPSLRWVHSVSVGVDHALEALPPSVVLTNARGVFDRPIAEMILTYILMALKRMPTFFRQQQARVWQHRRLREAEGLTVGLIGLGHIGQRAAQLLEALGMRVIAVRRHPRGNEAHVERSLPIEALDALCAESDFVVVTVPLTPETRHLIGEAQLRAMPESAWLINVARGAVVDEAALIRALREGWIGGAALDVFTEEPLPPDSPLWGMENVIITPHNSWSTPRLTEREALIFLENFRRYLAGEPLLNVVDRTLGY